MLIRSPLARDRRSPPGFIQPCQPTLSETVPTGPEWIHELKHDGFRLMVLKDGDRVRLWSRNGRDWSLNLLAITAAVRALPFARIMIDGEALALKPRLLSSVCSSFRSGNSRLPQPLPVSLHRPDGRSIRG